MYTTLAIVVLSSIPYRYDRFVKTDKEIERANKDAEKKKEKKLKKRLARQESRVSQRIAGLEDLEVSHDSFHSSVSDLRKSHTVASNSLLFPSPEALDDQTKQQNAR